MLASPLDATRRSGASRRSRSSACICARRRRAAAGLDRVGRGAGGRGGARRVVPGAAAAAGARPVRRARSGVVRGIRGVGRSLDPLVRSARPHVGLPQSVRWSTSRFSRSGCSSRAAVAGELLAGLLGFVLVWALVVKVFALDDGRRARLHEPIGYWNTLGLARGDCGPVGARLRQALARALLVYGAVVVVLLTQSRGALALAVAGAARGLWLEPARTRTAGWSLLACGAAGGRGGCVRVVAVGDRGRRAAALGAAVRGAAGWAALVVGALVRCARRAAGGSPGDVLRYAVYAVVPLVVAAAWFFVGVRAVQEFDEPVTPESPIRFAQGSSNNRAQWWKEAWDGFVDNPVAGNGAGAFQVTHRRYRESNVEVREPHSLPLQLLTETGVVGFVLFAGFVVAARSRCAARDRAGARAGAVPRRCALRHPLGLRGGGRARVRHARRAVERGRAARRARAVARRGRGGAGAGVRLLDRGAVARGAARRRRVRRD